MASQDSKTHTWLYLRFRRARWPIAVLLLLLTLAGCLTTHAAGPAERQTSSLPATALPQPTHTATATPTTTPGVTLVPNLAVHVLQATSAVTDTATPTDVPDTATPTPEPTETPEPTHTSEPTDTPEPTRTPIPPAPQVPLAPFQAYAWVDNYYPAPGSVVTVHGRLLKSGRPVNGAQMGATFSYTHGEGYCTAFTGIDGRTACAHNIGYPLQNYWVFIDVVFVYKDQLYYAKTGFLTDP